MSGRESDRLVEVRLAELRRNVRAALAGASIADVAVSAGLQPDEVAALIAGGAGVDLYVLARLEASLGVPLWPRPKDAASDAPESDRVRGSGRP